MESMKRETINDMSGNKTNGLQINFCNGYTLSVGFGKGHYCENQDYGLFEEATRQNVKPCPDMEVAVFNDTGFVRLGQYDDVAARVPVACLDILIQAARLEDWDQIRDLCDETRGAL